MIIVMGNLYWTGTRHQYISSLHIHPGFYKSVQITYLHPQTDENRSGQENATGNI